MISVILSQQLKTTRRTLSFLSALLLLLSSSDGITQVAAAVIGNFAFRTRTGRTTTFISTRINHCSNRCCSVSFTRNRRNFFKKRTIITQATKRRRSSSSSSSLTKMMMMVRNIDLPEAIIFYGKDVMIDNEENLLRPGLESLLDECHDVNCIPILITTTNGIDGSINEEDDYSSNNEKKNEDTKTTMFLKSLCQSYSLLQIRSEEGGGGNNDSTTTATNTQQIPKTTRTIWNAINSVEIQPKAFGGSSGFGTKQWVDPPRKPLPQHVVVFSLNNNVDVSRSARYIGCRCINLLCSSSDYYNEREDDYLSDVTIDDGYFFDGLYIDDISTPGSYWLNPSQPRDDDNNKVPDIQTLLEAEYEYVYDEEYGDDGDDDESSKANNHEGDDDNNDELQEDELSRILADLDPL